MPRFHRLAGAVVLALAATGTAHAQEFTGVVSFGDSLSDAGNYAPFIPGAGSFTTNPDPVWTEVLASMLGLTQTAYTAGGTNYAWGGAPTSAPFVCVPVTLPCRNVSQQFGDYLTPRGGLADQGVLHTYWAGANNIFNAAANPATAQQVTGQSAQIAVGQIGALQAAGAEYIVVMNLPDIGVTPAFFGTPSQASVSGLVFVYNTTLNAGLATLGDGIIPINTYGIINEILANPTLYGFTNTTGTACNLALTGGSSLFCQPGAYVAPGANETYLFADGVHPTGAAHAMLASVVYSTIIAPLQVSLAGEGGLKIAENHGRAVTDELMSDFQLDRETGSVRAYATGQFGDQDFDGGGYRAANADVMSLTLGANHRITDNAYWGVAITMGNHDNDVIGANIDSRAVIASIGGALTFGGGGYINGAIGGGSTSIDIERAIVMGPTVRHEFGSTNASQTYAELGFGWLFGSAGGFQHGPFVGGTWVSQDVDGYAEESGDSTSMNFAGFDRDSMVTRLGYQLMGGSADSFRPYLRVAHNEESEDGAIAVNAGSNSMNGRFTMEGYSPAQDWISADLGLNWSLGESTTAFAAYSGRFGDNNEDSNSFSLGLRMTF